MLAHLHAFAHARLIVRGCACGLHQAVSASARARAHAPHVGVERDTRLEHHALAEKVARNKADAERAAEIADGVSDGIAVGIADGIAVGVAGGIAGAGSFPLPRESAARATRAESGSVSAAPTSAYRTASGSSKCRSDAW
jgi:hypothetical protein